MTVTTNMNGDYTNSSGANDLVVMLTPSGKVTGTAMDATSMSGLSGVSVSLYEPNDAAGASPEGSAMTGLTGTYSITRTLPDHRYQLRATKTGYTMMVMVFQTNAAGNATENFTMSPGA